MILDTIAAVFSAPLSVVVAFASAKLIRAGALGQSDWDRVRASAIVHASGAIAVALVLTGIVGLPVARWLARHGRDTAIAFGFVGVIAGATPFLLLVANGFHLTGYHVLLGGWCGMVSAIAYWLTGRLTPTDSATTAPAADL